MSFINKYLRNFKPYKVASHKVWLVNEEERKKILKLDWNESTNEPTPLVKERIMNLLNNNEFFHLYPATYNQELLDLLSKYVGLPVENIQYFGSSDSLHEYIAKMYINVGDPVLILGPSYDNFRLTAEVNGASVFFFEFNEDFTFDKDSFEAMINKINPSLVYICNPNNPTGYVHSKSYIESLVCKFSETVFLVDEAYYEFSGVTVSDLVLDHENLLVSRTMSKAFALANFRFGYLIASKKNVDYISSIRNPKNITTFAQEATIAALSDIDYMKKYVKEVNEAKAYFINEINTNFKEYFYAYQSAGNFVLLNCFDRDRKNRFDEYMKSKDIYLRKVDHSQLLYTCIRISIGTLEQMKRVLNEMKNFINEQ